MDTPDDPKPEPGGQASSPVSEPAPKGVSARTTGEAPTCPPIDGKYALYADGYLIAAAFDAQWVTALAAKELERNPTSTVTFVPLTSDPPRILPRGDRFHVSGAKPW